MQNKVKVVVASNREMNVDKAVSVSYKCQYEYANKVRIIDSFGAYREVSGADIWRTDNSGKEYGTHKPMILDFSKTVMFHEFVYEENEKSEDFTETDKNTKAIVEKFFGKCPVFLVNGKSHSNSKAGDQFDVIDSNVKTLNAVHSFKDKLRAANKLAEMKHSERCDVAFFYGLHPTGKSEEELLVELGDGDTGYCLQNDKLADFLKTWVDGKSDDRDLLVTLKKAVSIGVIDNRKTDGRDAFFLGESFLGSDEFGMIDWVRKNPRDFNEHIDRKVKANEKKEEDVVKSIKVSNEGKVNHDEFDKLKKQAKELYLEGFIKEGETPHNIGFDKLKKVVAAALEKKNSVTI